MQERKIYKLTDKNKYKAMSDGIKLGVKTLSLLGASLSFYKAPYVKVIYPEALKTLIPIKLGGREKTIMPQELTTGM
ncbi:hypothetical protein ACSU1N_02285 [Thermogladius sp. 4427co]|uniref:hypothetical protein n=1 Tax=Thermogladius sp. 4427co TaxID=3450718 RepID=UPI003F7949FD